MIDLFNTIFSAGTLLDTEHGLVMLLLLYGLLTFLDKSYFRWGPIVIVAGILLSLVTPVHEINLFWPVITGLVVPPFLWQSAVAVTKSGPLRWRWGFALWTASLILVAASLIFFGGMPVSISFLLGILAVTLVWYFREIDVERSYLSTVGLITLVVLLLEIDIALVSLQLWLGTLLSGGAIGIMLGFLGVVIFRRLRQMRLKNSFFFLWGYVAYLAGVVFQTSAIATTLAAALVVSVYGFSIGLWNERKDIPLPSNFPFFFYLSSVIWITLGWQAHTVFNPGSLAAILPAIVVITVSILVVRKLAPISTENRWIRLLRKETGVFLLLIGAMLFWPQQAFLTTISVEIALAAAILIIILMRVTLRPIFDLVGVELSWPQKE